MNLLTFVLRLLKMATTLVSICIPAYKNVKYLQRLLNSIASQTFRDFEVIITDDSNDDSVREYINTEKWNFPLSYFKNKAPLGSPENWNAATSHAKGEWIKIMHHDDWFSSDLALEVFIQKIRSYHQCSFFFCPYENKYVNGKSKKIRSSNSFLKNLIFKTPTALISGNIIGPPSVTIYKNDGKTSYDNRIKWLVDIDFYIRYLKHAKPFYIDQFLINIGIHEEQVTKYSFLKPEIEIPEHLIVLSKSGEDALKNILVYDAFWRLIRNLKIKTLKEFSAYNKENLPIPEKLKRIIAFQERLPSMLLSFGPFSKLMMLFSYLLNRSN